MMALWILIIGTLFAFSQASYSPPDLSEVREGDRLGAFYDRLEKYQDRVKYCPDRTRMLPDCTQCIPGLAMSSPHASSCDVYISTSQSIRSEIAQLTKERFGILPANRTYGLYPCKFSQNIT